MWPAYSGCLVVFGDVSSFLVYSVIIIITIIKLPKDVSSGQQFNTQRENDNAAVQ